MNSKPLPLSGIIPLSCTSYTPGTPADFTIPIPEKYLVLNCRLSRIILFLFLCDLFLVARETCGTCVCCCTRYTIAALLSILRGRPRWRFPPSANKGPGQPACLCPPLFPSIPPSVHLTPLQDPAEKARSVSRFFTSTNPAPPPPPPHPLLQLLYCRLFMCP